MRHVNFFSEILNFLAPISRKLHQYPPDSTIQFPQFHSTFILSDFDEIWHEGSTLVGFVAANEY